MQFMQIALTLAAFPALLMASPTKNTKPIVARADAPPGGWDGDYMGVSILLPELNKKRKEKERKPKSITDMQWEFMQLV